MKYRTKHRWFFLLGLFTCAAWFNAMPVSAKSVAKKKNKKPNIIILLSDDAGYADFGFNGSITHLTPNIDQMAKEGVLFSNAYVSASVCSPSRAGLITGRYQNRFGHYNNLPGDKKDGIPMKERGLPLSELTFADLVKKEGYITSHIGKWHLGESDNQLPDKRGFDEYLFIKGGHHADKQGKIKCNYKDITQIDKKYRTDLFGDEACDFIERNQDKPFLLYLAFNVPHTPMHARPDYLKEMHDRFKTEARAINACMTKSLDDNVGKVNAKLKELGLDKNTLVVYINDNGGAMPYNASLNTPLRGTKGTLLEGGVRVPMLMKWPAQLPKDKVYEQPVISLDILPTAVSAAKGKLPDDRMIDGVDLVPFVKGKNKGIPHEYLSWNFQWAKAVRKGPWKWLLTPNGEECLYNLDEDIAETNNKISEHPEVAKELREINEEWNKEMVKPLWILSEKWKSHSASRYDQNVVNGYIKE